MNLRKKYSQDQMMKLTILRSNHEAIIQQMLYCMYECDILNNDCTIAILMLSDVSA